jgi:protein-S-isoprenylcysteine O-methyltransferase Ste14
MSLFEGNGRPAAFAFLAERVRRDLQFSNIFRVEFAASLGYAAATLALLARDGSSTRAGPALLALAIGYGALHLLKTALLLYLEKRGGDAREFVGSDQLVTKGVYALSRNPVYLLSIAQSFVWSLALIWLGAGRPDQWPAFGAAAALLYGHYWGIDRLIIPHEEAALARKHPQDFAAYCARVRRWFGRKGRAAV